ncbi:MAG TPA: hypothetical protein VFH61_17875 [Thermoleophilia bacterium]|nr:hypothetical protein [Thermoleophilia bacterium]
MTDEQEPDGQALFNEAKRLKRLSEADVAAFLLQLKGDEQIALWSTCEDKVVEHDLPPDGWVARLRETMLSWSSS